MSERPSLAGLLWRGAFWLLVAATPLFGAWLASSLAAYGNGRTWMVACSGLLLFPVVPSAWEAYAEYKWRTAKKRRQRVLTRADRMIFRTLGVNVLFLGALFALWPKTAFVALATRGDWMLDRATGPTADTARDALHGVARVLEWTYVALRDRTHDRPADGERPTPAGTEAPRPAPVPTAAPVASATSAAPDAPSNTVSPASAQPATNWPFKAELHPLVTSIPSSAETSPEAVGKYIGEHEPNMLLRLKALHDYAADRIAYDGPSYVKHAYPPQDAATVLQKRVGVCAGYADLLAEMGKAAGIKIVYVHGDARSESSDLTGESHAWNAAQIDGQWYLLDATWDAGYLQGETFVKRYSTSYFITPPVVFGVDHFPSDDAWQLRYPKQDRGDFFRQPMMTPAFYAEGMELIAPSRSQITVQGALDIAIKNPRQRHFMHTETAGATCTPSPGDVFRLHCVLPRAGTYTVKLFTNDKPHGSFSYVGQVEANSRP
jgi:transglutaminase-like putative cysteine protease